MASLLDIVVADEGKSFTLKELKELYPAKMTLKELFEKIEAADLPGVRIVRLGGHTERSPNVCVQGYRLKTAPEIASNAQGCFITATIIEFESVKKGLRTIMGSGLIEDMDLAESCLGIELPAIMLICRTRTSGSYCARGAAVSVLKNFHALKFFIKVGGAFDAHPLGTISVLSASFDETSQKDVVFKDLYLGIDISRTRQFPFDILIDFSYGQEKTIRKPSACGPKRVTADTFLRGYTYEWELSGVHDAMKSMRFDGYLGMISVITEADQAYPENESVPEAYARLQSFLKHFIEYLMKRNFLV